MTLDHDNDGDQDILIFKNEGGMSLFCNAGTGTAGNWLRIFLDTSDAADLAPNGYGSRVSVRAAGMVQHRYLDGGSNYLGSSELSAHFGLGAARRADGCASSGQRRGYRAASRSCQLDHDGHEGEGVTLPTHGARVKSSSRRE